MATKQQEQTRAVWDELARGFDEFVTPLGFSIAEDVLRLIDLQAGDRFLDIGAGSGAVSIPAARLGADVLATDISPAMIDLLEARARAEGLGNIEGRVMDAYALELDDDTFDVTGSLSGATILPEVGRVLGEVVRVTRRGGVAVVVNFGSPERAEFAGVFMGAMREAVPGFAPTDDPSPAFQLADPERMGRELTDAGLNGVRVEQVDWHMEIRSGEHLVNVLRFANPMTAKMIGDLTDEHRHAVEQVIDETLRGRLEGGVAVLKTECNVGIGRK